LTEYEFTVVYRETRFISSPTNSTKIFAVFNFVNLLITASTFKNIQILGNVVAVRILLNLHKLGVRLDGV
jgi:hypothetical protein